MNRRATAALMGLLVEIVGAQGCRRSEPPPIAMQAGESAPLTFPPPDQGWTDRTPLPAKVSNASLRTDHVVRLVTPELDEQGHFEFSGQTLRLNFDQDLFTNAKQAPALNVTPKVAGKATWYGGSYVEFQAEKPFDPAVEYTLEIPETTSPSGKKLEALKATFKATPSILIAGKTITYIPVAGHPRVVAIYPNDVAMLGGPQEITVIYDQPIDVGAAAALVTAETEGGGAIPTSLRHPYGNTFEGQKVDPRGLVVVKPKTKLAPGKKLTFKARSKDDANDVRTQTFTIATPTTLEKIGDEAVTCTKIPVIHHSAQRSLVAQLSNPVQVDWETANQIVHVTPRPPNLYVSAYERVTISGSFAPSTTYTVSVDAVKDVYGGTTCPFSFTLRTKAQPTSATIPDGAVVLDESDVRSFAVTTRNVVRGSLLLWPLEKGNAEAFSQAVRGARMGDTDETATVRVPFVPRTALDQLVTTTIDLDRTLERGRAYVARTKVDEAAPDVDEAGYPYGTEANRPSTAVLFAGGPNALGAHVHRARDRAVVQVFRLASGEPVGAANVAIGKAVAVTNELGLAKLDVPEGDVDKDTTVAVTAPDATLLVPMNQTGTKTSSSFFPEFGPNGETGSDDRIGMIVTDRGIYRPGSTMHVKAFARKIEREGTKALTGTKVRLRLVDPMDTNVFDKVLTTSKLGTVVQDVALDASWTTGRFHLRLELDDPNHTPLADELVRIVVFETPKFKVDVEGLPGSDKLDAPRVRARVSAKYLFGAPMNGAHVAWSIRKSELPVEAGDFARAGLVFERQTDRWWDDDARDASPQPIVGEGTIGNDGTFVVDADPGELAQGPTELLVEADVNDASYRHISGSYRTKRDPVPLHAGLKLTRRFGEAGKPVRVELGVVDREGHAVEGKPLAARIERLQWMRTATKAPSGATVEQWSNVKTTIGQCNVTSAKTATGCDLPIPRNGNYLVTATVDGRDDASLSYWSYGWSYDESDRAPSSGSKVPIVLDKASYEAGETAHVLVQSPYAKSLAVLTVEQGGILSHTSKRIEGFSATFDVPVEASNVPWVHAVVTLLPIGETQADYRIAAARIPVAADGAKLKVAVTSQKKTYEVGDEAVVTIAVKGHDGAPVKGADVALAVVDEGVLRMTGFHAKDAATALHPGLALSFFASDTRTGLLQRREKGHVAGGGDGTGEDALDARKNFVETAAWLPNLTTDGNGNVTAKFKLPDNLTEFRTMAVVVDDKGRGGSSESSFVVTKALLLEPAMPAFALRGDTFEAAAMVHNNTDAAVRATVTVAGQDRDLTIPARGHERVAVPMNADWVGTKTMAFALRADGKVRDKVEMPLRIDEPGTEEKPWLSGAFTSRQEVHVEIPGDAIFEPGATLSIKTGSALYPELGQRLGYLLDYPHGCVEQTTSSLLPLLAARTILPWTGAEAMGDAEIKKRIQAGVDRIATMKTSGGGLAYWPGGYEPNVYGTAYAMRALVRARAIGIEKPGLIAGATTYLTEALAQQDEPGLRVSIAEALALAEGLPAANADSLYDTRDKLDTFGLASLAIALSTLPNQDDRVRDLLDRLEASFDERGEPKKDHGKDDWYYWGSSDRDRAQALVALVKLRKGSRVVPLVAQKLSRKLDRWSTQSTAWSLMALADFVGDRDPRGAVDVRVKVEGKILDSYRRLGGDNKEVRVPLADLAGKKVTFVLEGDGNTASAFAMNATYKRPFAASGTRLARHAPNGMSLHRAYSDAQGRAIDLANVKAGDIVRVAVRADLPSLAEYRLGYVAITDRLPAGLAPLDPDLSTTTNVPELSKDHPYYEGLSNYATPASHVDLRDDRVRIYFDRVWNGRILYATYLTRATTPGTFTLPPAFGELMYEPDSEGYSDVTRMTVR